MSKKRNQMIRVETLPNGYCLKYDGMKSPTGFMYFTPEKLLEGFMIHIGMNVTDILDTETMNDFIATAMSWRDNKKCVKKIEKLTSELKQMTGYRASAAKRLITERNQRMLLYDRVGSILKETEEKGEKALRKELNKLLRDRNMLHKLTLEGLGVKEYDTIEEDEDDED